MSGQFTLDIHPSLPSLCWDYKLTIIHDLFIHGQVLNSNSCDCRLHSRHCETELSQSPLYFQKKHFRKYNDVSMGVWAMIKTAVLSHLYILFTFLKMYDLFFPYTEKTTWIYWFFGLLFPVNTTGTRQGFLLGFNFFMKKRILSRETIKTELIILSGKEFTFLMESGSSSCDRVPYPPHTHTTQKYLIDRRAESSWIWKKVIE